MKIAVDRNSMSAIKEGNEYIYLFEDEELTQLLDKNMHCIYYKNCGFVDINLTDYEVDCLKKAKITDKDYDKLEKKTLK